MGELICEQAAAREHHPRGARRGSRNPALNEVMQHQFLDQRKALIDHILRQAVDRGEIDAAAISDELWDLLPGYLIFRSIVPGRPPTPTPCKPSSTTSSSPASPDLPAEAAAAPDTMCTTPSLSCPVPYRTVIIQSLERRIARPSHRRSHRKANG